MDATLNVESGLAGSAGTASDVPMAVLVNRYSASASEVVAACLQDHDRAVVVGERTWGKGSVQNIVELVDGQGALRLTTASYHRPSGENIHRFDGADEDETWGVMPTDGFEVKPDPLEVGRLYRHQRALDIIDRKDEVESFKDRQLNRALEYLRKK